MFKLEQDTLFQIKLSEPATIRKDDEIYFGRDILDVRRFGAGIKDTVAVKTKVLRISHIEHRNQAVFLLQNLEEENTPPFFVYEKNLMKYGVYLKGEIEESVPSEESVNAPANIESDNEVSNNTDSKLENETAA